MAILLVYAKSGDPLRQPQTRFKQTMLAKLSTFGSPEYQNEAMILLPVWSMPEVSKVTLCRDRVACDGGLCL